jgi:hypothetical protein
VRHLSQKHAKTTKVPNLALDLGLCLTRQLNGEGEEIVFPQRLHRSAIGSAAEMFGKVIVIRHSGFVISILRAPRIHCSTVRPQQLTA